MKFKVIKFLILILFIPTVVWGSSGFSRGDFYLIPAHALRDSALEEVRSCSKELFRLEDGRDIVFVCSSKASVLKDKLGDRVKRIPKKLTFRMVIDEIDRKIGETGSNDLSPFDVELTISLNVFLRGEPGQGLTPREFSFTPLSVDLPDLNPVLYNEIGRPGGDVSRVLFHWEVVVDDKSLSVLWPDSGMQVGREVVFDGLS